jgi:hypothetical protein
MVKLTLLTQHVGLVVIWSAISVDVFFDCNVMLFGTTVVSTMRRVFQVLDTLSCPAQPYP